MKSERLVPLRSSLLPRVSDAPNGASSTRAPGRIRRAQALASTAVNVAPDYRGFTLDSLEAAVANLRSQGIAGDTPLVAKVGDHPFNEEVADVTLVAILALVPAEGEA